jgi:hypothetical protein
MRDHHLPHLFKGESATPILLCRMLATAAATRLTLRASAWLRSLLK